MFVKRVKIDGRVTLGPSWKYVLDAICSLNGVDKCDIAMDVYEESDCTKFAHRIRPPSLLISGTSKEGLVYILLSTNDDGFEIASPERSGRVAVVKLAGTEAKVPRIRVHQ